MCSVTNIKQVHIPLPNYIWYLDIFRSTSESQGLSSLQSKLCACSKFRGPWSRRGYRLLISSNWNSHSNFHAVSPITSYQLCSYQETVYRQAKIFLRTVSNFQLSIESVIKSRLFFPRAHWGPAFLPDVKVSACSFSGQCLAIETR